MIMKYTVVLEPQEEGGFTVQCVEIPGAISQGETREEALANIKEAIELVLAVQREELHRQRATARRDSSDDSTHTPPTSGTFEPAGTIEYGVTPPSDNIPVTEEQKGLATVEREALELAIQKHSRALDLLARH